MKTLCAILAVALALSTAANVRSARVIRDQAYELNHNEAEGRLDLAEEYTAHVTANGAYILDNENGLRVTCKNGGDATVRTADGPHDGQLGYLIISCGK